MCEYTDLCMYIHANTCKYIYDIYKYMYIIIFSLHKFLSLIKALSQPFSHCFEIYKTNILKIQHISSYNLYTLYL